MGTIKAREFANAYQRKIMPRGRTKEKIAAEAAYFASVVETAHPNRRTNNPYPSERLENAKQACICKLETFLGNDDYSNENCYRIIETIRGIYHNNNITNYTYGNAQKWVTIALKYYIVLASINNSNHIEMDQQIYNRFKEYKLFPVDQTIRRLLASEYDINFDHIWYECDDLEEFKTIWNVVAQNENISKPLWDWELDSFIPSTRARLLQPIYF